jgi:hypothetical protein
VTLLPAVAQRMLDALPPEPFDPGFFGQDIKTHYFDTRGLALWKRRARKDQYLTLRLRCYHGVERDEAYAVSAKTERAKVRVDVDADTATALLGGSTIVPLLQRILPAEMVARMMAYLDEEPLRVAACVSARRYATEDGARRLTLDTDVRTNAGKTMPYGVLEFKASDKGAAAPGSLLVLPGLSIAKLSKFLWSLRE